MTYKWIKGELENEAKEQGKDIRWGWALPHPITSCPVMIESHKVSMKSCPRHWRLISTRFLPSLIMSPPRSSTSPCSQYSHSMVVGTQAPKELGTLRAADGLEEYSGKK